MTHSLELEKNVAEFYKNVARQISTQGIGLGQPQNFYIGDGHQNQNFQALNSPQAAVGTGNRLIGNRNDQNIHIANSFNERSEQVRALSDLWMALHNAKEKLSKNDTDREQLSKAIDCVRWSEEELKEQDPPEPKRIARWLETAKRTILTLALTEEVGEAAKKVWELFQLHS